MEEEKSGIDPERMNVYKQYAETVNKDEKSAEQIIQEQRDSENLQTPQADKPPEVAEKKSEETVKEEELKIQNSEHKEQEKLENLKKALDEERGKRKKLREEKEILEFKIRDYQSREQPQAETPIGDYESEIQYLKRKDRDRDLLEARREEFARQDAIKNEAKRIDDMVDTVHKDLSKEGYPGFSFMAGTVTKELFRINAIDPDEAQALDNPDGWKKIYKETIYPKFKQEFESVSKESILDKKRDLKKEANLTTSTGKSPHKKDDEDPNTWSPERRWQEYKKLRGLKDNS